MIPQSRDQIVVRNDHFSRFLHAHHSTARGGGGGLTRGGILDNNNSRCGGSGGGRMSLTRRRRNRPPIPTLYHSHGDIRPTRRFPPRHVPHTLLRNRRLVRARQFQARLAGRVQQLPVH